MNERIRKVSDSSVEITHIVRPTHLNSANRLFGGILLQWIDETAGIVAKRHCHTNCITAAIDNLKFLHGAYKRDLVVLIGRITWVGRTSMEIRVDTYAEDIIGTRKLINTAYLVMVAMDMDDVPTEVPRLELETDVEKSEWEDGVKRQELRKMRKVEGF